MQKTGGTTPPAAILHHAAELLTLQECAARYPFSRNSLKAYLCRARKAASEGIATPGQLALLASEVRPRFQPHRLLIDRAKFEEAIGIAENREQKGGT